MTSCTVGMHLILRAALKIISEPAAPPRGCEASESDGGTACNVAEMKEGGCQDKVLFKTMCSAVLEYGTTVDHERPVLRYR